MHLSHLVGLTALLAACPSDPTTPPEVDTGLSFSDLPAATRARLVGAVVQDADVAQWLGQAVREAPAACMSLTADASTLAIHGDGCDGGAGISFAGTITVISPSESFPSYRFDHVRLAGDASDEVLVDGALDFDVDAATQVVTEHADLEITRAGIAVHTSISWSSADNGIVQGSFVELGDQRAELYGSRTVPTFVGLDTYRYTSGGLCGIDSLGATVCPWSGAPSEFARGTFHRLAVGCANSENDDGQLRFESASNELLLADVDGGHIQIGGGTFDAATGLYTFTTSWSCTPVIEYTVSQRGSHRFELTANPRVTWAVE